MRRANPTFRDEFYTRTAHQEAAPVLQHFLQNIQADLSGMLIYEIWAWSWKDTKVLAQSGATVVAIDKSPNAASIIHAQNIKGNYEVIISDIDTIAYPRDISAVFSAKTINIVPDKSLLKKRLRMIHWALKKGGYFIGDFHGDRTTFPATPWKVTNEELQSLFGWRDILYFQERYSPSEANLVRKKEHPFHMFDLIAQKK